MDLQDAHSKARQFFEDLWTRGDPWLLESSAYEDRRYHQLMETIHDRRYDKILEIGCGAGAFTRRLAGIANTLLAIDISETAINRARTIPSTSGATIAYRVANVMEYDFAADEPFDLVVMTETIYYLGWLYSFFDVGWLAHRLFQAARQEGRILISNTQNISDDYLLRPWLIRTYHDLFSNIGFKLELERIYTDTKDDSEFEVLISLFRKPPQVIVR
jgi:predicted TPR repeat methyltransferase